MDKRKNIGELLIEYGKISREDLEEGLRFQIPSMMQMAKADGMQLLDQAITEFLMQKIVSPEEAYIKANDKKPFERFLKKM